MPFLASVFGMRTRSGRRVGAELASTVESRVIALRHLDDHLGEEDLTPVVVKELDASARLVRSASYSDAVGRRLPGGERGEAVGRAFVGAHGGQGRRRCACRPGAATGTRRVGRGGVGRRRRGAADSRPGGRRVRFASAARESALYWTWLAEAYLKSAELDGAREALAIARQFASRVRSARADPRIAQGAALMPQTPRPRDSPTWRSPARHVDGPASALVPRCSGPYEE